MEQSYSPTWLVETFSPKFTFILIKHMQFESFYQEKASGSKPAIALGFYL